MPQPVTITFLEMTDPAQLRPKPFPSGAEVVRIVRPSLDLNRFFYTTVGKDYSWTDRLPWSDDQWLAYLNEPDVETWLLFANGEQAGYFELGPEADGAIDIRYFGLLPEYTGKGLGGPLLTVAVNRPWQMGAKKVTVNTCTLDHPAAIGHYLARGFQIVGRKEK